jgi:hypothetical protein
MEDNWMDKLDENLKKHLVEDAMVKDLEDFKKTRKYQREMDTEHGGHICWDCEIAARQLGIE